MEVNGPANKEATLKMYNQLITKNTPLNDSTELFLEHK